MATRSLWPVIVRGRIRDEFQCPITAQILRDPVVAKDGHTYERSAIMQWLETHKTSPMTKEEIRAADLVPNLNLKRLIYDLVAEGGQGLAAPPASAEESCTETALGFDDVMILRCLGPADSDWVGRTQVVTKDGIGGGRRRNSAGGRESMVFTDTTVSRRHFEAGFGLVGGDPGQGQPGRESFYIQDLGSAGGTYLRLRHREALPLRDGAMLLVGKHQFIVLAPSRVHELQRPAPPTLAQQHQLQHQLQSPPPHEQQQLPAAASSAMDEGAGGEAGGGLGGEPLSLDQTARQQQQQPPVPAAGASEADESSGGAADKSLSGLLQAYLGRPAAPLVGPDGRPLLVLKCFAPEGSPMQHRQFTVGAAGATVGRKQTNTVSLSQEKNGEMLGLDSAVSGEHCRIEFREGKGFVLLDGGAGGEKPSTNGTWARLSYMQMASQRQPLERDDEILVGGILRFAVSIETFLMEGVVPPRAEEEEGAAAAASSGAQPMSDEGEGSATPRSSHEKVRPGGGAGGGSSGGEGAGGGGEEAMEIS